jgi:hypothetical protein
VGKVIDKVHAIGAGHALIFLALINSVFQISKGILIELPFCIRKPPLIVVPPLVPEKGAADLSVFLTIFFINRLQRLWGATPNQ